MCVCVCVQHAHAEVQLWGSAHEGSTFPSVRAPGPLRPAHQRLRPRQALVRPGRAPGVFCPLTSVKNTFPGAEGVVWGDDGSFKDQTEPGHKKKEKKQT